MCSIFGALPLACQLTESDDPNWHAIVNSLPQTRLLPPMAGVCEPDSPRPLSSSQQCGAITTGGAKVGIKIDHVLQLIRMNEFIPEPRILLGAENPPQPRDHG